MASQLLVNPFPAGKFDAQGITAIHGSIVLAGSAVATGEPIYWNNLVTGIGYNEANFQGNGQAHGAASAVVTALSASGGVITATAANNFSVGSPVTFVGCTTQLGAKLNGFTFNVASASSSQFTFASTATGTGSSENGLAISGSSLTLDTPAQPVQTASVTAVSASGGIITATAANTFLPGAKVQFTNGSTGLAASLSNGQTYTVLTATSSAFTFASSLTGSTGTATATGANAPQPLYVEFSSAANSGYVYQYSQATASLFVLEVPNLSPPVVLGNLGAGAYPAGVTGDVIKYMAYFTRG